MIVITNFEILIGRLIFTSGIPAMYLQEIRTHNDATSGRSQCASVFVVVRPPTDIISKFSGGKASFFNSLLLSV